jgi:biofilm protein TabA
MILDSIDNIARYKEFNDDIFIGLEYVKNISPKVEFGEYVISNSVKCIVSEYSTKNRNDEKFEAHKHVIDIQYPIIGQERVQWSPLRGMAACTEYDAVMDRTYFINPSCNTTCIIGKGIFAIYFPEDAHNPQLAVEMQEEVIKKVTIKIHCS